MNCPPRSQTLRGFHSSRRTDLYRLSMHKDCRAFPPGIRFLLAHTLGEIAFPSPWSETVGLLCSRRINRQPRPRTHRAHFCAMGAKTRIHRLGRPMLPLWRGVRARELAPGVTKWLCGWRSALNPLSLRRDSGRPANRRERLPHFRAMCTYIVCTWTDNSVCPRLSILSGIPPSYDVITPSHESRGDYGDFHHESP